MSGFDVLVAGGDVVTPSGIRRADAGIKDGLFAAIESPGVLKDARTKIDATGKVVFPGVIDVHVHFRCRSHHVDEMERSFRAGALGGMTTAIGFLLPSVDFDGTPVDLVREFRGLGERESVVDFSFHAWIPDRPGILEQIPRLIDLGVPSFKLLMAYKMHRRMASDEHLLSVMDAVANAGGTLLVHAEDGELEEFLIARQREAGRVGPADFLGAHPAEAECIAIYKAIHYARVMGCPLYVVHVSSPQGADLIHEARSRGQEVWAETCPQYLELTNQELSTWGPLAKVGPPLRDRECNEGLWSRLGAGSIQVVGSDHSPHTRETKAAGYSNIFDCWYGAPGIQTVLPVMWDAAHRRGIPPEVLAGCLAEAPARIFGLTQKGSIAVGKDADLVLIDPEREVEIRADKQISNAGYSLYDGRRVRGWPVFSMLRGQALMEEGKLRQEQGYGKFIERRAR